MSRRPAIPVAALAVLAAAATACRAPRPASAPCPTAVAASAQTAAPTHPAAAGHRVPVMIVGLYHFDNPGLDYVKTDVDDHRSPRRQREIEDVVARLAAFHPTRILVEATDQDKLTAAYDGYRRGAALGPDEIQQIGFRLARRLGLPGLGAIDHRADMDLDRVMAAANASHDRAFLDLFAAAIAGFQAEQAHQQDRSVRELLHGLNAPARIARDRDLYLAMARVRAGGDYAGADVLATWYRRNFRIFANLAAQVTSPDDRVLVLFGAGHAGLLRELVAASPTMVLVEADDYL